MRNDRYREFRVSGKSNPTSIAGALSPVIREACFRQPNVKQVCEMVCIGAAATNQAIKAIAVANGMIAPNGLSIACIPAFDDLIVKDEEKTAMRLIVITQ